MFKKIFSFLIASMGILVAHAQTATFSSFTYTGRDSRFNVRIDPKTQYLNPIISGYYPDPTILHVGDTYWLANSSFGYFPGVPLFKSKDLMNWTQVGSILNRPSQLNLKNADIATGGIYAPHLSYNPKNKTYYMTTMNMSTFQVFYVTSKNPEKGWSEPVQMKYGGMDTSFLFDKDGKAWVVYNTRPFDKNLPPSVMAIHMNEFDWRNDSIKPQTWELATTSGAMNPSVWIEGPHLYHIGKYYYLMCAEGGTGHTHSEVIFRSKKITGPYESFNGNPILTQRDLSDTANDNPVCCAGHADLVHTKEGKWFVVFLGCRPYEFDTYNTGRETFLLPVTWKDGLPIILEKGKRVPTVVNPPSTRSTSSVSFPETLPQLQPPTTGNFTFTDDFKNGIGPEWLYLRNPEKSNYKTSKGISITPTSATLSGKDSPSAIFFRQKNTDFTAETVLTFIPKDSAIAGITAFQNEKNHLVLGKTLLGGKPAIVLTMTKDGKTNVIASTLLSDTKASKPIKLRIDGDDRYYSFSYAVDNGEVLTLSKGVDCKCLSTIYSGGFVGTTLGLYTSLKNNE